MSNFMEPQITEKIHWHECEDAAGDILFIPEKDRDAKLDDYRTVRTFDGYGTRFSAPGYVDATDWTVHDTLTAAIEWLFDRTEMSSREEQEQVRDLCARLLDDTPVDVTNVPAFNPDEQPVEKTFVVSHGAPVSAHLHASDAYQTAVERAEQNGHLD